MDLFGYFTIIFWSIFFLKIFTTKNDSLKIKIMLGITLCVALFSYYFNSFDKQNFHTISFFNIYKTTFCVFFYNKLFKDAPEQNIKHEPSFWVITGLFLFSCLSIPFYALNDYIKSQFSFIISTNIFASSNILIIIMHFFFIKAYICTIRLPKE